MPKWFDVLMADVPATAPRELAPNERGPLGCYVPLPEGDRWVSFTYADAEALHTQLGQHLARGMRRRGSHAGLPGDDNPAPLAPAMPMALAA